MITIYCYNKCSTCKKALKYLEEKNISYILKDIITEHPTKDEMKEIIKLSKLDIKKFFNYSGNLYKELKLKDKLDKIDDDSKLDLLISNGMLIKRPLVITNNNVLLGFKEVEWNNKINNIKD